LTPVQAVPTRDYDHTRNTPARCMGTQSPLHSCGRRTSRDAVPPPPRGLPSDVVASVLYRACSCRLCVPQRHTSGRSDRRAGAACTSCASLDQPRVRQALVGHAVYVASQSRDCRSANTARADPAGVRSLARSASAAATNRHVLRVRYVLSAAGPVADRACADRSARVAVLVAFA